MIANKDAEIDRLNGIYIKNLAGAGVEIFDSRAELVDAHTVNLVGLGKTITAERILVATGGTPRVPGGIKGVEHTISSNEVFHLDEMPKRVIVSGGGYIAVEFASIFNGLGAETHLIYRGEQILRGFDNEVRQFLFDEMTKKGVNIILNDSIEAVDKQADGLHISTTDGKSMIVDQAMLALGRVPAIEGLGLEKAGVELNKGGAIAVDSYSKTNVDSIYAVGDVTDRVNLTPVAIREGHAFADTVYGLSLIHI